MNGTCGSGKTTIGAAVAELAARSGESVAFVDMDALSQSWPRPQDDPFNKVLGIRNLSSVVRNFSDDGVMSVVIAGVIRDEEDLARYEEALRLNLTVVRLLAPLDVIDERLRSRHGDADAKGMAWHRQRAPELSEILDRSAVRMVAVSNTRQVSEVAQEVFEDIREVRRPQAMHATGRRAADAVVDLEVCVVSSSHQRGARGDLGSVRGR